ncbi:MAG TPA: RNA polymerase sigma factor [Crocinitomicaceae bacterium]|nr:RNA polymerase sigma factor [Crocinitomicaceae bacterium]
MRLIKPQYKSMTDESLMISISKGDKRAFDEIYHRYSGPMLGYFMSKLWKDREKAEDFVHDIFAKIIKKPESFDVSRKFKTWFYSVANNMCKNEYKKQEVRKNTTSGLDGHYALTDTNSNVMEEVQDAQFRDEFEESLAALDDKHKETFRLRHIDGLSIKEIAEVTEKSEGTVKSRLFYATKYLAESLKEFNPVLNR